MDQTSIFVLVDAFVQRLRGLLEVNCSHTTTDTKKRHTHTQGHTRTQFWSPLTLLCRLTLLKKVSDIFSAIHFISCFHAASVTCVVHLNPSENTVLILDFSPLISSQDSSVPIPFCHSKCGYLSSLQWEMHCTSCLSSSSSPFCYPSTLLWRCLLLS